MKKHLLAVLLIGLSAAFVWSAEMVAPSGYSPAEGAKASAEGYANHIVHDKTGIELVLVSAGDFTMGDTGRFSSAVMPPHKVTLAKPFYIGKTEVTNAQYRKFVDASGYEGKPDTDPAYDLYLRHWRDKSIMSAAADFPVVWVSWNNAKAFCDWAGLSLPSEAQWEYACRAQTTTLYYNGDEQKGFDEIGWGLTNSDALTHPVAQKKPNAWGLYDMLGNVWEWCEDDYVYRYDGAPDDGSARVESPRTITRALRGGSWSNTTRPTTNSSASRFNSAPANASNDVGFRVLLPIQ